MGFGVPMQNNKKLQNRLNRSFEFNNNTLSQTGSFELIVQTRREDQKII
jgi:hypothetical protein